MTVVSLQNFLEPSNSFILNIFKFIYFILTFFFIILFILLYIYNKNNFLIDFLKNKLKFINYYFLKLNKFDFLYLFLLLPIIWLFYMINFLILSVYIIIYIFLLFIYMLFSFFFKDREYVIFYKNNYLLTSSDNFLVLSFILCKNLIKKKSFNIFYTFLQMLSLFINNKKKNTKLNLNEKFFFFLNIIFDRFISFLIYLLTSYTFNIIIITINFLDILKSNFNEFYKQREILLFLKYTLTDFLISVENNLPLNLYDKKIIIKNKNIKLNPKIIKSISRDSLSKIKDSLSVLEKNNKVRMLKLITNTEKTNDLFTNEQNLTLNEIKEDKPHISEVIKINYEKSVLIRETKSYIVKSFFEQNNKLKIENMGMHTQSTGTIKNNFRV